MPSGPASRPRFRSRRVASGGGPPHPRPSGIRQSPVRPLRRPRPAPAIVSRGSTLVVSMRPARGPSVRHMPLSSKGLSAPVRRPPGRRRGGAGTEIRGQWRQALPAGGGGGPRVRPCGGWLRVRRRPWRRRRGREPIATAAFRAAELELQMPAPAGCATSLPREHCGGRRRHTGYDESRKLGGRWNARKLRWRRRMTTGRAAGPVLPAKGDAVSGEPRASDLFCPHCEGRPTGAGRGAEARMER